jgi:carboxyl-terminal processing protease
MSQNAVKVAGRQFRINPIQIISIGMVLVLVFGLGVVTGQGKIQPLAALGTPKQVSKNLPANLDYSSVEDVYDKLRLGYDGQMDTSKLLDGLKEGLAQATGDPFTEYFNPADAKTFNDQLNGTFSGIGAELGKDANNNVVVISPLAGYPAEQAGLKAKDLIETVNGKPATGQSVDQVVTQIRGQEGTKVTLKVLRNGTQELTIEITRAQIKIASVKSSILDGNIGYLQITQFSDDTVGLAQQAATQFKQANVKGVILDMRSDPGGLLDAAVKVSSMWLDQSQVVLQEKRGGVVTRTYNSNGNATLKGIKTVVLINEGSASASEITAGALRDNKAATLIGVKSFGKGSVQQLEDLGDGSLLKVTIAHWFTPSGAGIDKKGIDPDQTVKNTDDDIKNGTDPQKQAAIDYLNK